MSVRYNHDFKREAARAYMAGGKSTAEIYPKSLILHSDQGQQFAFWEFVMFCKEQGIT